MRLKRLDQTLFHRLAIEQLSEHEYERFDVDFRLYNANRHRQGYDLREN